MSKSEPEFKYRLLNKNDDEDFFTPLSWTPDVYFQFANREANSKFKQSPIIEWWLSERSHLFFSQGLKPDEFKSQDPEWWGQGYVIIIQLIIKENGKIGGIIDLVPTCNKDDNLPGTTVNKEPFIYNGIEFGVKTKASLSGSTGGAHEEGEEQIIKAEIHRYPGETQYLFFTRLGAGIFVGLNDLIGNFRVNSGILNRSTIRLNPLFKLLYCNNSIREATGSDFWFERILPEEISESLLQFLLKELPLKEGQKRQLTLDSRKSGQGKKKAKIIKLWKSITPEEMKTALEKRLLYFSSEMKGYEGDFYSVASLIRESERQNIFLNVDCQDELGRTPLSYCAETASTAEIKALIQAGANPFLPDKSKKLPIDYDIKCMNFSLLKKMITIAKEKQDDLTVKNLESRIPGYIQRRLELKAIDEINKPDSLTGNTLIYSIIDKHPPLLKDVLNYLSPDLKVENHKRYTPFDWFLTKKTFHKHDLINLEKFIRLDAPFTVRWKIPHQLHDLMVERMFLEVKAKQFRQFFLLDGLDINSTCKKTGLSFLTFALIHKDVEAVKILLKWNANPNHILRTQKTLLNFLVESQNRDPVTLQLITLMLQAGADPYLSHMNNPSAFELTSNPIVKELMISYGPSKLVTSSNKEALLIAPSKTRVPDPASVSPSPDYP